MMLTVVSLPFLCAWGLPISLLSIVGNLAFGPFLAGFLGLSSCLFFAHLLGLPTQLIGSLLNIVCSVWLTLLSFGSTLFLVALPDSMLWLTIVCTLGAVVSLHHKKWGRPKEHLIILCGFVTVLTLASYWYQHSFLTHTIYNKNKTVVITHKDSLLTLEDHGGLTEKRSPASFVQFSLLPGLCKKAGTLTIDQVIIHTLTRKTVIALKQLAKTARIKKIVYAPYKKSKSDVDELVTELTTWHPMAIEPVATPK